MSSNRFQSDSQQPQPEQTHQPDGRDNNQAMVNQPVTMPDYSNRPGWIRDPQPPRPPLASAIQQPAYSLPPTANNRSSSKDYRQSQVDRVSGLLKERYRRIFNETNSRLLLDVRTAEVLPEIVDAILAPIAMDFREIFNREVSRAEIVRAFGHFGEKIRPWPAHLSFGRAGYNPQSRQRFIDAGSGCCLTFDFGASYYHTDVVQPLIRPTQSRSFPDLSNIGNTRPALVNQLFECTALPGESDLLLLAWMILSWMPDRSQVMLELLGPPSSSLAKAHALVRNLVDPSTVDWHNDLPSNGKQFEVLALKHYLLSFNQVEVLTPTQQKHIFSLMRSKSLQWKWKGKKLDVEVTVQCPVMLNSLESVATVPTLADSTLSIEVEDVGPRQAELVQLEFTKPAIQVGFLMIFGHVNSQWASVEYEARFNCYGSLADLCRVGELVAESLGRDRSEFWQQFEANQQSRREFELEESPVALAVQKLLSDEQECVVNISVRDWLSRLEAYRPKSATTDLWPASSRQLGAVFKSIIPLMRGFGITLTSMGQRGPRCYWRAEKLEEPEEVIEPEESEESEKLVEPERIVESEELEAPGKTNEPDKPEQPDESEKPVELEESEESEEPESQIKNRMRLRDRF
jgi:hypothetical protein